MCACAGFHSDPAARLPRKERQDLLAPELLAERDRAGCSHAGRLENVLGQIQADGANPTTDASLRYRYLKNLAFLAGSLRAQL
jgi:hypothetical protein